MLRLKNCISAAAMAKLRRDEKSPFLFLCEFVHIVISAAILVMCDAVDADDGKENSIKENT